MSEAKETSVAFSREGLWIFFVVVFNKFVYLFIFGCVGSLLLCTGFF